MHRILIVEDDATIAELVKTHLIGWGFEAQCVEDFKNVLARFAAYDPHIVLMDISLPFYNGYYWCSEIRKLSKVPVIFVSSASDNMNIVMAVNMGGDDFVAKPFSLDVLTAKINAVLRRTYDFGMQTSLLEHKGAVLNLDSSVLTYQGAQVELTKNEYRILSLLMGSPGKIIGRSEMMMKLWETDSFVDENTLTVNVTRLRKKLEYIGLSDFIVTKKGLGYVIE